VSAYCDRQSVFSVVTWFYAADTMQWTAVDLIGLEPECRLDFATCTLRLRLSASNSAKSRCMSHLEQTDGSSASQQSAVECSGSRRTLHCGSADVMY